MKKIYQDPEMTILLFPDVIVCSNLSDSTGEETIEGESVTNEILDDPQGGDSQ